MAAEGVRALDARSEADSAAHARARPAAQPEPGQGLQETEQHDPLNLNRAREIAVLHDPIPVGILYHNPDVPCYEELRNAGQQRSTRYIKSGLEAEFDKFTIWPQDADGKLGRAPDISIDRQGK